MKKLALNNFYFLSIVIFLFTIVLLVFGTYLFLNHKFSMNPKIEYVEVEKVVEKKVIVEKTFDEYMNDYYRWPIDEPVWVTSSVGPRSLAISNETFHRGDDSVGISKNVKVKAAADGVVVEHWLAPNGYYKGHPIYGGYVIIQHDNGTFTAYAHMSDTKVHQGQKVSKGDIIGVIGNTGLSTGTHLHFEVILTPHRFISLTS